VDPAPAAAEAPVILWLACAVQEVCFDDDDHDGFGAEPAACTDGAATSPGDCDDADASVSPGAPETCDGRDEDCDGAIDDDDPDLIDGLPFWSDADHDGFGTSDVVTACAWRDGLVLVDGDCDDTDPGVYPGAPETCDGTDRDCDGHPSGTGGGVSEACPADSCLTAVELDPGAPDGVYWVTAPGGGVVPIWCDQTTEGGGWTLGFLRNTASTGSQGDFGKGDVDSALLAQSPGDASVSATPVMAWLDLEAWTWTELRMAAYAGQSATYSSRDIPRSDLRIAFGDDGYYLFGEGGYYWCGGASTYTDAGIGAVNNPPAATPDCKGHGSLGSGWDFSEQDYPNAGLTLCGGDGSYFLSAGWGGSWTYYGAPGGAQAIWVR
jgi:hypothetical protein